MHHPEALILRRCYPVPVTFADLRAAYRIQSFRGTASTWREVVRRWWAAALKEVTGAIDEVYAVVDGREVRVAIIDADQLAAEWRWSSGDARVLPSQVMDLLDAADRAGYWERPHEVRLDLQERPVSHDEVASAVLVGQEYVEQHGGAR